MAERVLGELKVVVEEAARPIEMKFFGESDSANVSKELRELFSSYEDLAAQHGLLLDFRELEYMNSSSFPPIVELIRGLHTRKAPVTVLYSQSKAWQRTPFTAISSIASVYDNLTVKAC